MSLFPLSSICALFEFDMLSLYNVLGAIQIIRDTFLAYFRNLLSYVLFDDTGWVGSPLPNPRCDVAIFILQKILHFKVFCWEM